MMQVVPIWVQISEQPKNTEILLSVEKFSQSISKVSQLRLWQGAGKDR